jgi:hypothetical protein
MRAQRLRRPSNRSEPTGEVSADDFRRVLLRLQRHLDSYVERQYELEFLLDYYEPGEKDAITEGQQWRRELDDVYRRRNELTFQIRAVRDEYERQRLAREQQTIKPMPLFEGNQVLLPFRHPGFECLLSRWRPFRF